MGKGKLWAALAPCMTNVLKESLGQAEHTGRRGGRAGRVIEGREG